MTKYVFIDKMNLYQSQDQSNSGNHSAIIDIVRTNNAVMFLCA